MDNKRKKQAYTFTLDPHLMDRMRAWIDQQELPPPQNAVVAMAIREFLDNRGAANG